MSILEIVILGIMINFALVGVMFILTFIYSIFENKFNFDAQKNLLQINYLLKENKELIKKCKEKDIFYFTQDDFVGLIPFSGIVKFIIFSNVLITGNLDNYVISKLYEKNVILSEKLNKHKKNK